MGISSRIPMGTSPRIPMGTFPRIPMGIVARIPMGIVPRIPMRIVDIGKEDGQQEVGENCWIAPLAQEFLPDESLEEQAGTFLTTEEEPRGEDREEERSYAEEKDGPLLALPESGDEDAEVRRCAGSTASHHFPRR